MQESHVLEIRLNDYFISLASLRFSQNQQQADSEIFFSFYRTLNANEASAVDDLSIRDFFPSQQKTHNLKYPTHKQHINSRNEKQSKRANSKIRNKTTFFPH